MAMVVIEQLLCEDRVYATPWNIRQVREGGAVRVAVGARQERESGGEHSIQRSPLFCANLQLRRTQAESGRIV